MHRFVKLAAALTFVVSARAAAAQNVAPADSQPRSAAPIVVVASRDADLDSRARVLQLLKGNAFLVAELRRADARVDVLENHLADLKRDAEMREQAIAAIDAQTAAIRAERLALEARLASAGIVAGSDAGRARNDRK